MGSGEISGTFRTMTKVMQDDVGRALLAGEVHFGVLLPAICGFGVWRCAHHATPRRPKRCARSDRSHAWQDRSYAKCDFCQGVIYMPVRTPLLDHVRPLTGCLRIVALLLTLYSTFRNINTPATSYGRALPPTQHCALQISTRTEMDNLVGDNGTAHCHSGNSAPPEL